VDLVAMSRLRLAALPWILAALAAWPASAADPIIDHQPVPCSLPGEHPRICATIADDGEVKRTRVYFRAAGEAAYYFTEMELDFRNFCATLPVPKASTRVVEYHVWAVDDELATMRTTDVRMTVDPGASCPSPVIDRDPERISHLVVFATTRDQGKKLADFEDRGVDFRPVKKR
jgi:hypothetical protein